MSQPSGTPIPPSHDRTGAQGGDLEVTDSEVDSRGLCRRSLMLAGLGLLVGCASQQSGRSLPGALWPEPRALASGGTSVPAASRTATGSGLPGVLPRENWARGNPITTKVNRMTTPHHITIHHDGMNPFHATNARQVAAQIERIRSMHVGSRGWGDIGYHYVVDRSGRAWAARPIKYQGAHVEFQNPGNIGVLCLGNFEEQNPSRQQLSGLHVLLVALSNRYRVPERNILTHREWSTASTLCPGRNLQNRIDDMRRSGTLV